MTLRRLHLEIFQLNSVKIIYFKKLNFHVENKKNCLLYFREKMYGGWMQKYDNILQCDVFGMRTANIFLTGLHHVIDLLYNYRGILRRMLGIFLKVFSQGRLSKWQLPKCAIYQAETSQRLI